MIGTDPVRAKLAIVVALTYWTRRVVIMPTSLMVESCPGANIVRSSQTFAVGRINNNLLCHQQPRSWRGDNYLFFMMTSSNEKFLALLAICAGNSPRLVNSPHKGQWRGALMFSLICVWINGCVNNSEAGDLRRYRAHYDITVMSCSLMCNAAAWRSFAYPIDFENGHQDMTWITDVMISCHDFMSSEVQTNDDVPINYRDM